MKMAPFRQITEHHICIVDERQKEKRVTKEQEIILFQLYLADVLLFGAGTLNEEQQIAQDQLQEAYLKNLKPGDTVEIGLETMMPYHPGVVVSNDSSIVKIQASCYGNKRKKEGIRSFSTEDGRSKGFLFLQDDSDNFSKIYYYLVLPESHTVKSTAGIPQEALNEIDELYQQAGDEKTCYDLVNSLKYGGKAPDSTNNLLF